MKISPLKQTRIPPALHVRGWPIQHELRLVLRTMHAEGGSREREREGEREKETDRPTDQTTPLTRKTKKREQSRKDAPVAWNALTLVSDIVA